MRRVSIKFGFEFGVATLEDPDRYPGRLVRFALLGLMVLGKRGQPVGDVVALSSSSA